MRSTSLSDHKIGSRLVERRLKNREEANKMTNKEKMEAL